MHAIDLKGMHHNDRVARGSLRVDTVFCRFVEDELLPAAGIDSAAFWPGLEAIVDDLTPVNCRLLEERDDIQERIDTWHRSRHGEQWSQDQYVGFLRQIGYLRAPGPAFRISTTNVDSEIAEVAGPQLVVPVSNARFAINAANARWGSLYDSLYGSDVIESASQADGSDAYDPVRGRAVIDYAVAFLDRSIPLMDASHAEVIRYQV